MSDALLRTPLVDWHAARGARLVDFAGWLMPVQYSSIVEEHRATRTAAGLFDISHMGRLRFTGSAAATFLDRILTRRVVGLGTGLIRYALVTNEAGGILDDVLVYHLQEADGAPRYSLVVNASNRLKIVDWLTRQRRPDEDVQWVDETQRTAMLAIQGPRALAAVAGLVATSVEKMPYYTGCMTTIGGVPGVVSRTGYTGEDGCEWIVAAEAGRRLWEAAFTAIAAVGGTAAGLGARDTLRLEAAMPLYGHELSEDIDPFQAGLQFAVHLDGHDFPGRATLAGRREAVDRPRRIGLALDGKRVPRQHYAVLGDGQPVGEITSGTFSPTLERPIAMAYVRPDAAAAGTRLTVDIRGRLEPAEVVPLPFYRRPAS